MEDLEKIKPDFNKENEITPEIKKLMEKSAQKTMKVSRMIKEIGQENVEKIKRGRIPIKVRGGEKVEEKGVVGYGEKGNRVSKKYTNYQNQKLEELHKKLQNPENLESDPATDKLLKDILEKVDPSNKETWKTVGGKDMPLEGAVLNAKENIQDFINKRYEELIEEQRKKDAGIVETKTKGEEKTEVKPGIDTDEQKETTINKNTTDNQSEKYINIEKRRKEELKREFKYEYKSHEEELNSEKDWERNWSKEFLDDPEKYFEASIQFAKEFLSKHPNDETAQSVINNKTKSLEKWKAINKKYDDELEKLKEGTKENTIIDVDNETIPGSNEIKNPKYKEGSQITVRRNSGKIEDNWWVMSTSITKQGRTIRAHRGTKYQTKLREGTIFSDFPEGEIDELNKNTKDNVEGTKENIPDKEKIKEVIISKSSSEARLVAVRQRQSELTKLAKRSWNKMLVEESEELKKEEISILKRLGETEKEFPDIEERSKEILNSIAQKIKSGIPLSESEKAIHDIKTKEVEEILKNFTGSEAEEREDKKEPKEKDGKDTRDNKIEVEKKLKDARDNYITEYKKCRGEMERQKLIDKTRNSILSDLKSVFSKDKTNKKKTIKIEDFFKEETKKAKREYDQARIELGNMMYEREKTRLEKDKRSDENLKKNLTKYKEKEIFQVIIVDERKKMRGYGEGIDLQNQRYTEVKYKKMLEIKKKFTDTTGEIRLEDLEKYEKEMKEIRNEIELETKRYVQKRKLLTNFVGGAILLISSYVAINNLSDRTSQTKDKDDLKKKEASKPNQSPLYVYADKYRDHPVTDEEVGNIDINGNTQTISINPVKEKQTEAADTTTSKNKEVIQKVELDSNLKRIYDKNINLLFLDNERTHAWDNVKEKNINDLFKLEKENGLNQTYQKLTIYLHKIQESTGLDNPKENETVSEYMTRLLQQAQKNGKLDNFKL